MRKAFLIAILLGLAAIPVGVALMAAPEYTPAVKEYPAPFFWVGLFLAVVLIGAAIVIAGRGEATEPRFGHRRRMIALGVWLSSGSASLGPFFVDGRVKPGHDGWEMLRPDELKTNSMRADVALKCVRDGAR
jgi:hypothetical protein